MSMIRIPDASERVMVSRPMVGLFAMQVCAVDDATDEEILEVCNRDNPCGTSLGWCKVIRKEGDVPEDSAGNKGIPCPCVAAHGRTHFLITC
jgi:hypothetical protein